MTSLFSIAYLPPISYLEKFRQSEQKFLEQHEHFIKQTYRNRCYIYGPNGKQALIIPVEHENLFRIPIKEVKISNATAWNKIHWKSIEAAYRNAPYFEYYEEEFKEAFVRPDVYLFDFNLKLLRLILDLLKIDKAVQLTELFEKTVIGKTDYRNAFDPHQIIQGKQTYRQVFSEKHGFIEDLSCIDLLFNVGPGS